MQYRPFCDVKISALGFGAMRMPTLPGTKPGGGKIDEKEAIRMIRRAIDGGLNYVDTAYPYHEQQSEYLVGKALKDGYREKVYIATKSPLFSLKEEGDFDRILDEQLQKLDIDCIDFYLLHAADKNRWKDIVLKFDLLEKMEQAKAAGKIKHIGFSFHDDLDTFKMIVDSYPWDFCQIQFNYINTDYQAGMEGLEYAASKGLGVVVMEPLLGGKLAKPPVQVEKLLSKEKTPVEWALDFLWNRPEVGPVLSGMSTMEQVEENLSYADRSGIGMLSEKEVDMLKEAKVVFDTMALVPCTKCAYCMPCPFGLDIPKIYEAYNMTASAGMKKAGEVYESIPVRADVCKQCKKCEKVCPQGIESSALMPVIDRVFAENRE